MKHSAAPPFQPHPLLSGGHAQTILAAYLPGSRYPYRARQHKIPVSGGDHIVLHDDCPSPWRKGDPVAILIHGVAGSYASGYMVRTAGKLNAQGLRTFRFDVRGCGASLPYTSQPGHAGRSDDVETAVNYVAEIAPASPLTLVGFSLGGNMALKLAGEAGETLPGHLRKVIALSPPIDLMACAHNIWRKPNRRYDRSLVKQLVRRVEKHRHHVPAWAHIHFRPRPKRLYDFDHMFTAPLSGFSSVEEYYVCSSAIRVLHNIRVPTTILTAADDPLVPAASFDQAKLSPTTRLHVTERGGHLGYLSHKNGDPDRRWMEWRIVQWTTEGA